MKSYALAIGIAAAVMGSSLVYASHAPSFYNPEDGRYANESDHFAASRIHPKNAPGAMIDARATVQGRQVRPSADAERRSFNQATGYKYGNCAGPIAWPCN